MYVGVLLMYVNEHFMTYVDMKPKVRRHTRKVRRQTSESMSMDIVIVCRHTCSNVCRHVWNPRRLDFVDLREYTPI